LNCVYDETMERQIATVDADGQFVLPPDLREALHLEPGSSWEVSIDDSCVILNPVVEAQPEAVLPPSVIALRGMFAGKPSMEDGLLALRRSDEW
jgi:bifunctional DNA-binding transcriptional regulator/antitoxin component of YhaV-PrlF toxin-antitoxin module